MLASRSETKKQISIATVGKIKRGSRNLEKMSPNLKVSGTPHFDTCPCIYIYVCVYVCVYVYVYVCICLCMYIYISIYTTCCFVTCVCYFYPVVCPIRNISYNLIDFLHMGRQPHFIRKHVPNQKLFHWRLHV